MLSLALASNHFVYRMPDMNNPGNLALGAAGVAAPLYFTPGNPFNTPAVKAVGDAHVKGGWCAHSFTSNTNSSRSADKRQYAIYWLTVRKVG